MRCVLAWEIEVFLTRSKQRMTSPGREALICAWGKGVKEWESEGNSEDVSALCGERRDV